MINLQKQEKLGVCLFFSECIIYFYTVSKHGMSCIIHIFYIFTSGAVKELNWVLCGEKKKSR